jgi:hypothetical protein
MKAPEVAVKELLARQSALYDALENIAAKAVKEVGRTSIDLYMKNHPKTAGLLKYGVGTVGAGLGLGGAMSLFGGKE